MLLAGIVNVLYYAIHIPVLIPLFSCVFQKECLCFQLYIFQGCTDGEVSLINPYNMYYIL